uniref:Toxin 9 isoform c S1 n=1 Tax=Cupiennius salei TaxID=6928 RepID=A0A4Y5UH79_CUPSA|nr:toxin 9 isoform c S1 precursor [Cupiennius salei]QDC23102.1 toxin 9 isoform c S2 precursor [Cupiennius salei]
MKVLVICAVLFLAIFSNSSAETEDDFLEDESFQADDVIPFLASEQVRKDDKNCIPKHHECTNDKKNCCKKGLLKLKCQCFTVADEKGTPSERCACGRPLLHKIAYTGTKMIKGLL